MSGRASLDAVDDREGRDAAGLADRHQRAGPCRRRVTELVCT